MKLHTLKLKAVISFMLMICVVMPFIYPIASASAMATHIHICHDEEHGDNCVGTKKCCKLCKNIYDVKSQLFYYDAENRLCTELEFVLSFSTADVEFHHLRSMSLISLKVRLNN